MKRYTVTVTVGVLATSEHAAWEYGNALAGKAPNTLASGVDEDPAVETAVEVEDVSE